VSGRQFFILRFAASIASLFFIFCKRPPLTSSSYTLSLLHSLDYEDLRNFSAYFAFRGNFSAYFAFRDTYTEQRLHSESHGPADFVVFLDVVGAQREVIGAHDLLQLVPQALFYPSNVYFIENNSNPRESEIVPPRKQGSVGDSERSIRFTGQA
jgi:hypothetical protein